MFKTHIFKTKHILSVGLSVVMLGSIFTVIAPINKAEALTCKNSVVTHRHWARSLTTYGLAQQRARIKWRAAIRTSPSYGWAWSDWDKARDKRYECKKTGPFKNWRDCKAYARPCK